MPSTMPMHPCSAHAPTHARPSWPVNQNPDPTPPEEYISGLHHTAAQGLWVLQP